MEAQTELQKSSHTTKFLQMERKKKEDLKQCNEFDTKEDNNNLKKQSTSKMKSKLKKNKTRTTETQNISVKSSLSKFDGLQKQNLIHNPLSEAQKNCRLCDKAVFKMEEVKAEKNIYHNKCFCCTVCKKQLKVDTYQSHGGILYCTVHFKLLFVSKPVEVNETVQSCKPELIICENQPAELSPDVIRASEKPNLGLEELQKLDVRSKFKIFEQEQVEVPEKVNNVVRQSTNIAAKMEKLQKISSSSSKQQKCDSPEYCNAEDDMNECSSDSDNQKNNFEQPRELPVGIGEAMNDIRNLFEKGYGVEKEERREERKQEIQNIRSRLFMGKQARIKEMYQQAVAESVNVTDNKRNIDIEIDSKLIRQRFENGEVFKEVKSGNENDGTNPRNLVEREAEVFESAISKKSRCIFMELDGNTLNTKKLSIVPSHSKNFIWCTSNEISNQLDNDVIKYSEAVEDVKIETSQIREKFNFFEKSHPATNDKKIFRITPPREGVIKTSISEENKNDLLKELSPDRDNIVQSKITSFMLQKFQELEKNSKDSENHEIKPPKCFTPPPDGNRCSQTEQDSSNDDDSEDGYETESSIEGVDDNNTFRLPKVDDALTEAHKAAGAKQLRIKFEKMFANENKPGNEDKTGPKRNTEIDDNGIESILSIKEHFEKMRNNEKCSTSSRARHEVNRFV